MSEGGAIHKALVGFLYNFCNHPSSSRIRTRHSVRQCGPSFLPVSVYEAGVDVVGPFQAPDWLQADARGLVGHDVDQPVLELVAGQVGADEARRVRLGVGQALEERREA